MFPRAAREYVYHALNTRLTNTRGHMSEKDGMTLRREQQVYLSSRSTFRSPGTIYFQIKSFLKAFHLNEQAEDFFRQTIFQHNPLSPNNVGEQYLFGRQKNGTFARRDESQNPLSL